MGAFEHQAPSITWTGLGTGDEWDNEANWNTMVTKPTYCQDVIIPAGSMVMISHENFGFGGTLLVQLNATLEVANGVQLEINNNPTF